MTFTREELRIIGMAGPAVIQLLRKREENVLKRIYGDRKAGNLDQNAALAEFTCIRDLITDLTSAMNQNENIKE